MLFYECSVQYERQMGEDNPGKVKESYLIEGATPSDVEKRLIEEIKPYIFGECEVPSINKRNVYDILLPSLDAGKWYWVFVELITLDDSGKESRKKVKMLVQASTIGDAFKKSSEYLSSMDCEITKIQDSKILEVFRIPRE